MASYTIVTSREREAALNYAFEHYATEEETKEQFLQRRVNEQTLNPMVVSWKYDQAISLDKSIATIPEENEAKASTEIQAVIVDNGGVLVPTGPSVILPSPPPPLPPPPIAEES